MIENLEQYMDAEMKETAKLVIKELTSYLDTTDLLTPSSPVSKEVALKYLTDNNIEVLSEFEDSLNTVFALTKYILLTSQALALRERVETELKNKISTESIVWYICRDFSHSINFSTTPDLDSDQKPQSLTVSYRIDKETDQLIYSIASKPWNWDITLAQLNALLNNTIPTATPSNATNAELTSSFTKDGLKVTAGNLEIIIKNK